MGLVDITHVSAKFIGVSMTFLLIFFSLLSAAFVFFFQQRVRRALLCISWSAVVGVIFYLILASGSIT